MYIRVSWTMSFYISRFEHFIYGISNFYKGAMARWSFWGSDNSIHDDCSTDSFFFCLLFYFTQNAITQSTSILHRHHSPHDPRRGLSQHCIAEREIEEDEHMYSQALCNRHLPSFFLSTAHQTMNGCRIASGGDSMYLTGEGLQFVSTDYSFHNSSFRSPHEI